LQIVSVVAVILDHRWKEWPVHRHYIFPDSLDRLSRHLVHVLAYLWCRRSIILLAFWSKIRPGRVGEEAAARAFIPEPAQKTRAPAASGTAMSQPPPSSAKIS